MACVFDKDGLIEEGAFDTGTVTMNYAEGPSSGQPLVLLHGGASSWRSFLTVIPKLIHKWHVYAPDFRGHGRSGWVSGGYRWINFVEDTIVFLRHQVVEPAILWGSSFGGTIAICVAAQAPDIVRALILEDAWLDFQTGNDETRKFLLHRRDLVASVDTVEEMIVALKNELVMLPGRNEPVRREVVDEEAEIRLEAGELTQLDPEVYTFGWDGRLAEGYDMDTVLGQIHCPVLLLQANPELGGLVDNELAAHAMTLLSQGRLASFPEARHSILQSQPKAAMRTVNKFLESLSEAA
jgi:pimeloyl-ACP methyl ester carboxylesterase